MDGGWQQAFVAERLAPLDRGLALADLQRLVDQQEERIDLELALALDEVTLREGG